MVRTYYFLIEQNLFKKNHWTKSQIDNKYNTENFSFSKINDIYYKKKRKDKIIIQ